MEHFGGSGAILLGMPKSSARMDVFNDSDWDLTNLFLCVRDRPLHLLKELDCLSIHSEAEFNHLKYMLNGHFVPSDFSADELSVANECFNEEEFLELTRLLIGRAKLYDVKRAAAFYKLFHYSFSSTGKSYGIRKVSLRGVSDIIRRAADRLDGVAITNRDSALSIGVNDSPATLHYCDPPYYKAEDKYRSVFSKGDHIRLRDALRACEGYTVISYNFCPYR